MDISDKLVVVSGASSGIGAATAIALAKKGAKTILLARNTEKLNKVAEIIKQNGGKSQIYTADLSIGSQVTEIAKTIMAKEGTPEILINNAGAGRWLSIGETSAQELEQIMAVPYFAAFNLTREFLPSMKKCPVAHIVNVTSVASCLVWPGAAAYTAARWAMMGFNESLAMELKQTSVGVSLAMFATVETDYWQNNPGSRERLPKVSSGTPALTTEQVAGYIISGIEKNTARIIKPSIFKLLFLFPKYAQNMMWKTGWRG